MPTSLAWFYHQTETAYALVMGQQTTPDPANLQEDNVLVAIEAVSLNYRDLIAWKNLAGRQVSGRVPASDGAGTVVAVGRAVQQWKPGDRVAGCFFPRWQSGPFDLSNHQYDLGGNLDGMLRQHAVMHEDAWVRIPSHMKTLEASTLPCAALTAWYSLVSRGGLRQGQTVLVLGTGGVSIFALQIAKRMGARVVITSSDDRKLERARSLGADHTVNYETHPQWSEQVWKWTEGRGVDHVVEVGGPGTLEQSMRSVAGSGHIALIGVLTGFGAPSTSLFPLLARNVTLNGIYVGPRDEFVRMNRFFEDHEVVPVIDRVFSMDDVPDAFAYLASGQHFGKVVIQVA
jgi:NADPH:quinone reductase-like Zn-dependent oxidoreductase